VLDRQAVSVMRGILAKPRVMFFRSGDSGRAGFARVFVKEYEVAMLAAALS